MSAIEHLTQSQYAWSMLYAGLGELPTMLSDYYLDLMNRGFDPEMARPGECGCGFVHE